MEYFILGGRGLSLFDLLVLVTAIALFGDFDKGGTDNLAGFCEDTLVVKRLIETVEQGFDDFFLNQRFAELPDRLAVGDTDT